MQVNSGVYFNHDGIQTLNRTADKMAAMLNGAIEEFAAQGLAGATMESIASRAAVSKRTLYKHFANKDCLFDAVMDLLLDRITPLAATRFDPAAALEMQLRGIARRELELLCDPEFQRLSRIVMIECMRSPAKADVLMQRFSKVECEVYAWFEAAARQGALGRLQPRVAAELFFAPLKEVAYWKQVIVWQPPPSAQEQAGMIDEVCGTLLARIREDFGAQPRLGPGDATTMRLRSSDENGPAEIS